ncbi:hypothetical protein SCHPADRAFT_187692 [Schizopora paradoxa]|uniref:Uncharacterized protein n=1 Tax=Schizopora paradoxa TaxID=27342 RepID=A0A0H2S5Z6_9AGAM|nr:hypothetical protein SCHPADRAFT_187692 [Schizopora paradoxa]
MASPPTALASIPIQSEAQPLSFSQLPASQSQSSEPVTTNGTYGEPPPSQPPNSMSAPAPRVFVYPNGTSIPIFVEANGVSNNRPKIVRSLKKHGAELVHDPANARIILVEPISKEGRYFVREWQADAGKSVLDVAWAAASLERGRALMQEDQYGGFGNLSGEEIKDDDDVFDHDGEGRDGVEGEKSVTPAKLKRKKDKDLASATTSQPIPSRPAAINSNQAAFSQGSSIPISESIQSPSPSSSRPVPISISNGSSSTQHNTSNRGYDATNSSRPPSNPRPMSQEMGRRPSNSNEKRSEFKAPGLPTPPGTSSSTSVDFSGYQYPSGATQSPSPSQQQPPPSVLYAPYQTYGPSTSQSFAPPSSQTYDVSSNSRQYGQPQTFSQTYSQPQPPPSQFSNQVALVDRRSIPQGLTLEMQHQMAVFASMSPEMQQLFLQMQGAQMPRALPAPPGFSAPPAPLATSWDNTPQGISSDQYSFASTQNQHFNYNNLSQNFQQTHIPNGNGNGFQVESYSPPPPPSQHSSSSNHGRLQTPPRSSFSLSSQEADLEPETPPIAILERGGSSKSKGKKRSREALDAEDDETSSITSARQYRSKKSSKRREKHKDLWTSDPLPSQVSPSQKPPPIGIFTGANGKPIKFFYQLISKDPEKKRIHHISKIKANGGAITSNIQDAAYIILIPQSPLYFDNLKSECIAIDRVALKATFIDACLEEGAIVNEEDYILDLKTKDSPAAKKTRGRPSTHSISFNTSDASPIDEELESILESLPTPPPPEYLHNGNNKFTDEEHEFVLKCAAIIYRRNPQIPNTKLFAIIGEKCTSHSAASWNHHSSTTWAVDLEMVRSQVKEDVSREEKDGQSNGVEHEEADLQNITNFFAVEPEGSDESLWVDLAEKHQCITARSWQEFYQNKQEEVNLRLRSALGME